jgi:hypothetical protein
MESLTRNGNRGEQHEDVDIDFANCSSRLGLPTLHLGVFGKLLAFVFGLNSLDCKYLRSRQLPPPIGRPASRINLLAPVVSRLDANLSYSRFCPFTIIAVVERHSYSSFS